MKLEVGMYCRYKNFQNKIKIAKIKGIQKADEVFQCDYMTFDNDDGELETNIIKASFNIIDILECGDIIKLFMEDDIDEENTNIFELIAIDYNANEIGVFNSDFQIEFFPIENLRGILTHEQFEKRSYKVGE